MDRDRRPGRFVLTGSANLLLILDLGDSLAGRMEVVQLQPLTAAEQVRAPGRFLASLLAMRLKPSIVSTAPKAPLVLALSRQGPGGVRPCHYARTSDMGRGGEVGGDVNAR